MDSSRSNRFDIFEIYQRYCDIRSGCAYVNGQESYKQDDESQPSKTSRDELTQLLKSVESRVDTRISIFDEIFKLISQLGLVVDFSEFARFYDFVFFICRENGQKNITVSKAVTAWRLVLAGRFRLLNQWCDFVEKNQRHNISEDTWQQVLSFSRCVHENLEGYDPEGAWPVLIDEFVEHMYRVSGTIDNTNLFCNCGDLESQSSMVDDPLPGLRDFPGLKRKVPEDPQQDEMESLTTLYPQSTDLDTALSFKRIRLTAHKSAHWVVDNPPGNATDDCMEIVRHNSPLCSSKSPCAVEGCLSKGFAGLFSTSAYLQFDRERRVSFT
ncbi:hypothetical protein I3843_03G022100 [Carya illinoinensis]|uniref:Defective in cullin neddylation protein n=1 Tax=Carya illinoinensis TaxID=32201 RepID=A0A922FGH4_CARIL|nr:hypothetical protein I3760_03G019000 [Carya illinoinensis]KAG6719718.1 hypothetical protein I3842_03G020800 [Carya illinoinensis]KAG7985366.1 hypothetical protein I3843_03G022100 [Carya illinoinensis]